jgi:hypothetical protein
MFGYGRWSKIRSISKHTQNCKMLWKKTDEEMRPYANMLLIHMLNCLSDDPKFPNEREYLTDVVLDMI